MSARALGFLVSTLLLGGPSRAGAQAQIPFELQWSAPAECPDGPHVRAEILKLAGAPAQPTRHLKAQALIQPDERKGWTLALTTDFDGITGERHLSGISCQSLSEAASLTLALILNPEARVAPTPEPPAPAQAPPPTPEPRKEPWPALIWQLGALAGLQVGVLSDPSPFLGLSLGVALGRFSALLLPGFTPPQNLSAQGRSESGGRLWALSMAALGCYAVVEGKVTLSPCLGANLVRLRGRGRGVSEAHEATVYWTSAELALRAGLSLSRLIRLEFWGFGLMPLYKSSVYLDEVGLVSRPASFGFGALAGFSLAWP